MACDKRPVQGALYRVGVDVQNKYAPMRCTLRKNHRKALPHFDDAFNLEWLDPPLNGIVPPGWRSIERLERERSPVHWFFP